MNKYMPEWIYLLYVCYLGKDKGTRLGAILDFLKNHEGQKFFEQYSTQKDTILDFIKRAENQGIKLT